MPLAAVFREIGQQLAHALDTDGISNEAARPRRGDQAGVIEFLAGILIAIGLFAGFVAFIAAGEMAAAYFKQHSPGGFWPIVNRGELAVLFCFVFLYIASQGSGILSIDALIARARKR